MPSVQVGDLTFIYSDTQLGLFQEIHVADTLSELSAQTLINNIREAEASQVGVSFPRIADASGKAQLSPGVLVGITVQLLDSWRIYTLKDSGRFAIGGGNVVKGDGSSPFIDNPNVTYIQNLAVASTVVESSGGGGGSSAADVWAYASRSLTDKTGFSLSVLGITAIVSAVWAASLASLTSGIGRMLFRLGKKFGLTSVDVIAKTDEYMRTSDNDVAHTITVNPDGSKTLSGSP